MEPKDKGNRALQLMAPPGMEGRSGLERLTWRALGEAALKQVSVVTGRLSAPVASSFLCLSHFHEKEMATHSSVLAWRIPGTGEPGGLPFLGSHRVGHD